MQIHLAQENAFNQVLSTVLRFCIHLHLGACPDWDWRKEWRNQNARISFYGVFPLPSTLSSAQVNTSKSVKDDCVEGNLEMPRAAMQSRRTCVITSTPLIPRPDSSSVRARASEQNTAFLPLRARGRLLPSRSSHPRSEGQSAPARPR